MRNKTMTVTAMLERRSKENGCSHSAEIKSVTEVVFQKPVAQKAIEGGSRLTHSRWNIRSKE